MNHSSHVYVQLLGQKVLEAGENLQVPNSLRFNARHLYVKS